jgi:hypothetical protein
MPNPSAGRRSRCRRAGRAAALLAVCIVTQAGMSGCLDWSALSKPRSAETAAEDGAAGGSDAPEASVDPFTAAAAELEPGEAPYLQAARPFIAAMAQRDYAAAFGHLSPTATQKFSRNQFLPAGDEQQYARYDAEPIVSPTVEQFVELMQEVEQHYGTPHRLDPPTVETDPEVLSRQDPLLAAFEIGALPDSIPVAHRKAAVQGWVYCRLSDEQIRKAAETEGLDAEEYRELVRSQEAGGEGVYFKLKTVVIDEGAGPVIGYFEIAQRSLLD